MFAVHGQHAHAVFARLVHHDFAGHDEDFLGGDGDVLARANGGERGLQSRGADDGDQHDVRLGQRGEFEQAFVPRKDVNTPAQSLPSASAFVGSVMEMAFGLCRSVCSASNST